MKHIEATYLHILDYCKGYDKRSWETTRWRGTKGESGKVLSAGASVSMELGCTTLPYEDVFTNLKPFKHHSLGILMEAWSCRHLASTYRCSCNSMYSPSPFSRGWGWTESSKLLIMANDWPLSKKPPSVTSIEIKMLLSPRNLGAMAKILL